MQDNHFRELLKTVQGKDISDDGDDVKEILEELLQGEFRDDIKHTRFSITVKEKPGEGSLAEIKVKNGKVHLWVNPKNWENSPNFAKGGTLRSLLRHELLHVALNETDDSPFFKMVARQKGIDIWNV